MPKNTLFPGRVVRLLLVALVIGLTGCAASTVETAQHSAPVGATSAAAASSHTVTGAQAHFAFTGRIGQNGYEAGLYATVRNASVASIPNGTPEQPAPDSPRVSLRYCTFLDETQLDCRLIWPAAGESQQWSVSLGEVACGRHQVVVSEGPSRDDGSSWLVVYNETFWAPVAIVVPTGYGTPTSRPAPPSGDCMGTGVGDWINRTIVNARLTIVPARPADGVKRSNLTMDLVYHDAVQRYYKFYLDSPDIWREWSDGRTTDALTLPDSAIGRGHQVIMEVHEGTRDVYSDDVVERLIWTL